MNGETVVHADNEYYSELKTNELSSHEKTGRKLKCLPLYDSNYVIFCRRQNYEDSKKISSYQELQGWGERVNRQSTENI